MHRHPGGRSGWRLIAALGTVAALCAGIPPRAEGGDPAVGRVKAQSCTTCHGPLGIAQMPATPNLAGQPEIYLAAQLRAFRSGKRVHEVMNVMAKPLSDADIDNLAAWFASIEISAKPPPETK